MIALIIGRIKEKYLSKFMSANLRNSMILTTGPENLNLS